MSVLGGTQSPTGPGLCHPDGGRRPVDVAPPEAQAFAWAETGLSQHLDEGGEVGVDLGRGGQDLPQLARTEGIHRLAPIGGLPERLPAAQGVRGQ